MIGCQKAGRTIQFDVRLYPGLHGRPLKPEVATGIAKILFAFKLRQERVELSHKFWRHSASGMVANEIFQPGLLAGHQIHKFKAIDVLKRPDRILRKVSVLWQELIRQIFHKETAIID